MKILMSIIFSITILAIGLAATGTAQFDVTGEAVDADQAVRESLVLPWEPAFLIDGDDSPEVTRMYYGACTHTFAPCRSNAQCPPFLGLNQKCHSQCP